MLKDGIGEKDLISELKRNGKNHIRYKHYSKKDRLIENLSNRCLFLTDSSNWNDRKDSQFFCENAKDIKRFGMCFSYALTENVAMWIIYSKIKEGNALMLSVPKKTLARIINNNKEAEIGNFTNGEFVKKKTISLKDLYLIDLYYTSNSEKSIRCTRGEKHISIDKKVFEKTKQYSKAYPWRYENECRLIAEADFNLCHDCEALKIKLSDEDVSDIKKNLIEGPLNFSFDFKKSSLYGDLNF